MTRYTTNDDMFSQMDANRDGVIDRREFRNWQGKPADEVVTTSVYEPSVTRIGTTRYDQYPYVSGYPTNYGTTTGIYPATYGTTTTTGVYPAAYGATTTTGIYPGTLDTTTTAYSSYGLGATGTLVSAPEVFTTSMEETNRYLERSALSVYKDIRPQIIRRANVHCPLTTEQRVLVRYLQPPPLPPPEPIIIKEVRAEQPPPPPPLVIREQAQTISQAALILRERPPAVPLQQRGEIRIRHIAALPPPPRSLIIERFPALQKPRDIIIERWLPYRASGHQQTIVQRAPPPAAYTAAQHTIILYDECRPTVIRKFENLGVIEENPEAYRARYGAQLLDSITLLQYARNAGVIEDLSLPALPINIGAPRLGNMVEYNLPVHTQVINSGYPRAINTGYTTINPGYTTTINPGYTTVDPGYSTIEPGYTTTTTINPGLTSTSRNGYERIHRVVDTEPTILTSEHFGTGVYRSEPADQPNTVYETADGTSGGETIVTTA